jgi:hypothetical protein
MLIRDFFIRSTNQSEADTEFPDVDIFESDIRPSLEGHGIFKYILRIFENIWYLVTLKQWVIKPGTGIAVTHSSSFVLPT